MTGKYNDDGAGSRPALNVCRGFRLDFSGPTLIMGILNVTPDSFSDGGNFFDPEQAISRGIEMEVKGADIIDIGGESTRPGSETVSVEDEIARVVPVISALSDKVKIPISIDTRKSGVARAAVNAGASIINDVTGLKHDPKLADVAAEYDIPIILSHIKGTPKDMQTNPEYDDDLMGEIISSLEDTREAAIGAGVHKDAIILDPGIGFGKKLEHNLEIIRRLPELKKLGSPVLIGPSRKSFIGMVLGGEPKDRLEGTAASVAIAVNNGADIVRVHDVAFMKKIVTMSDAIVNKVRPSQ